VVMIITLKSKKIDYIDFLTIICKILFIIFYTDYKENLKRIAFSRS